jgi:uncharacterized metal-binding protein YceD (DUF177 family)
VPDTPPLEQFYDLNRLSNAGGEMDVVANPEQLAGLAEWFDVESIEKFSARIFLRKLGSDRYRYNAVLTCDLTQQSVVTLEPVKTRIEEEFSREYHVRPRVRGIHAGEEDLSPAAADDDLPEELVSPNLDLAGPLLEELSLALDPYPRRPGEDFDPPADDAPERPNPFAVLKRLKGED